MPPTTNQVVLSWGSLGSGTQYYVQTSTDLQTWSAATSTAGTNVSLALTGDMMRTFRLWASNAPPQSVTLAWDPSVPSTDVAGYSIFYGASTGNYTNQVDVGLATSGVVPNLAAGTTYYFAVAAYSASGMESDLSSEVVWQSTLQLEIQRSP